MNLASPRVALILLFLAPGLFAQDSPAPALRLAALELEYRAQIEMKVDKPHLARMEELDAGYTSALARAMQTATRDGQLTEAVALRDEQKRVADKAPLPETDEGLPPLLGKLRTTYRDALGKLAATRQQSAAPLQERFSTALDALQRELTKAGKLDDALAVAAYRKANLAEELLVAGANRVPSALTAAGKTTDVVASATKERPYENQLGMQFVPVPITGGPTDKKTILFSVWETRVQDYQRFIETSKLDWPKPVFPQEPTHPALNVTWEDAVAFAEWLTKEEQLTKRIRAKDVYRLPSDHEWSCAVGIGKDEDASATPSSKDKKFAGYAWGSAFPPVKGAGNYLGEETKGNPGNYGSPIPGYDDGFDRTSPVGSFPSNGAGLYDLGGNVWEWCAELGSPTSLHRVCRGNGWSSSDASIMLASRRGGHPSTYRSEHIGFRLVLDRG